MYVLVIHDISDPQRFFDTAAKAIPELPEHLKLHLTVPARDGIRAICVWEAESSAAVREYLEPALAEFSRNEYFEAENFEGIAMPTRLAAEATA